MPGCKTAFRADELLSAAHSFIFSSSLELFRTAEAQVTSILVLKGAYPGVG